jgi:serine/threonine-protein kinase
MIEQKGPIPLHRAINIANQIALSLAAAHDKGVIHRDLKPENIMLIERPGRRELVRTVEKSADGEAPTLKYVIEKEKKYDFVKLLDFGIAKVLAGQGEHTPGTTLAGAVFGTPEYMSPEAARGDDVDHRADIYSLGVIFFDMLCGRPPFEAQAAAEVLAMQINKPAPLPRDVNPHVEITEVAEALIMRAMDKNPDKRHQSMDELREQLQLCFGSVAFKRNARALMGDDARGLEGRQRRLTDELSEWMNSEEEARLSPEDARMMAIVNAAEESFARRMSPEEQERVATALDEALDDEDGKER